MTNTKLEQLGDAIIDTLIAILKDGRKRKCSYTKLIQSVENNRKQLRGVFLDDIDGNS
jgi:hypothetical protein